MATDNIARGLAGYAKGIADNALTLSQQLSALGRYLAIWNATTGLPTTNPPTVPYTYKSGDYYIVGAIATSGVSVHTISISGTTSDEGTYSGTYEVTFTISNQTSTAYTTISDIATEIGNNIVAANGTLHVTGGSDMTVTGVTQWTDSGGNLVIALTDANNEKLALTSTTATISDVVVSNNYKPTGSTYTGVASTAVESSTLNILDIYYYDGTAWTLLTSSLVLSDVLRNTATGNYSLTIGGNASTTNASTNVGYNSSAFGWGASALGADAQVGTNASRVPGAIQIGRGTNSEAGTLCIGLSTNGSTWVNYKLLDNTGKVPSDRVTLPLIVQSLPATGTDGVIYCVEV